MTLYKGAEMLSYIQASLTSLTTRSPDGDNNATSTITNNNKNDNKNDNNNNNNDSNSDNSITWKRQVLVSVLPQIQSAPRKSTNK